MEQPSIWELILRELDDIKHMLTLQGEHWLAHERDDAERFAKIDARLNRIYGGIAVASFVVMVFVGILHYNH